MPGMHQFNSLPPPKIQTFDSNDNRFDDEERRESKKDIFKRKREPHTNGEVHFTKGKEAVDLNMSLKPKNVARI